MESDSNNATSLHMVTLDRDEWTQLLATLDYLKACEAAHERIVARYVAALNACDGASKLHDVHVLIDQARAEVAALDATSPARPSGLARPPVLTSAPASA